MSAIDSFVDAAEDTDERERRPIQVAALDRLGGGVILCDLDDVVLDIEDGLERGEASTRWIAANRTAAVDLREVA